MPYRAYGDFAVRTVTIRSGMDVSEVFRLGLLLSLLLNIAAGLTGASNTRLWASGVTAATWVGLILWRQARLWRGHRVKLFMSAARLNWIWVISALVWSTWLFGVTSGMNWFALRWISNQTHDGRGFREWIFDAGQAFAWPASIAAIEVVLVCVMHLLLRWLLLSACQKSSAHWTRYGIHLKPGRCVSRNAFLLSKANLLLSCMAALMLMWLTGHVAWVVGCVITTSAAARDFEVWSLLVLPPTTQVGETTTGDLLIYLPSDGQPTARLFQSLFGEL